MKQDRRHVASARVDAHEHEPFALGHRLRLQRSSMMLVALAVFGGVPSCSNNPLKAAYFDGVVVDANIMGQSEDAVRKLFPNIPKEQHNGKKCQAGEVCVYEEKMQNDASQVDLRSWAFKDGKLVHFSSMFKGLYIPEIGQKEFDAHVERFKTLKVFFDGQYGQQKCRSRDSCEWYLPKGIRVWLSPPADLGHETHAIIALSTGDYDGIW